MAFVKMELFARRYVYGSVPLLQMRPNRDVSRYDLWKGSFQRQEDTNRQRWMIILGMGVGVIGNPIVTMYSHESFLIFAISVIALSVASFIVSPEPHNTQELSSRTEDYCQYVNSSSIFSLNHLLLHRLRKQAQYYCWQSILLLTFHAKLSSNGIIPIARAVVNDPLVYICWQ